MNNDLPILSAPAKLTDSACVSSGMNESNSRFDKLRSKRQQFRDEVEMLQRAPVPHITQ